MVSIVTAVLMNNPPTLSFSFVVVGGLGPSLSGLLLTRLIYGPEGMKAIGARLRNGRVARWWLALLIIPAVTALTPFLRWAAGYEMDGGAMLGLIGLGLALIVSILIWLGTHRSVTH